MSMVVKKYRGARTLKVMDNIVDLAMLTGILLLIAFACYAMWDSNQVHKMASAEQYALYKPSTADSASFEELRAINPEVFAWLTVYGTKIDYPVAQAKDNEKYVTTDAFGEYSASGCI